MPIFKKRQAASVARIIFDADDRSLDQPMWLRDAQTLHSQGRLQKTSLDQPAREACYCAPRSWRQITAGKFPPLHVDATVLISKAVNAGAKLLDD